MSKKRFLAAGAAVLLALGLGTGLSAAQTTSTPSEQPPAVTAMHTGDHDAMHEQMRGQMPEGLQAQCDTMHQQMGTNGMGTMQGRGMGARGMMGSTTGS